MQYAMIRTPQGLERPARFDGTKFQVIDASINDLRAFIALPEAERARVVSPVTVNAEDAVMLAPLRPPKNVFCVGRNYLAHAEETTRSRGIKLELPDVPTFFSKAPTAIVGPNETANLPAHVSAKYDWEAELDVVIGERCRDVAEADALSVVFGYCCVNDISARDVQQAHVQWFKGKSLDGTCPLGPYIVTRDSIADPQDLDIHLRVNGVEKQHGSTSQMIFSVARIIAELSKGMTLEAGDVIATGTPDGVGFARNPPEYLRDGDIVEVEIAGLGILRNPIALHS